MLIEIHLLLNLALSESPYFSTKNPSAPRQDHGSSALPNIKPE